MASKGISAFIVILAVSLAISVLAGVGYYSNLHVNYGSTGADADVQAAAHALTNQQATNEGGSVFVEFTTSAATTFQSFWQVISNTSGVLKLLFGFPDPLAQTVQLVFRIAFGISFAAFIRGVTDL